MPRDSIVVGVIVAISILAVLGIIPIGHYIHFMQERIVGAVQSLVFFSIIFGLIAVLCRVKNLWL